VAEAVSWRSRSAWAGVLPGGGDAVSRAVAGVAVAPREGLGLATSIVRSGKVEEMRALLAALYNLRLPSTPTLAHGHGLDLVWAGPAQWLAVSADRAVAVRLSRELNGVAAVSDQSDARAILRISGKKARDTLAKGCSLDLHPRVFRPGDAALTAIAHIGVHLWQIDDTPTYDLAIPTSMAKSLWHWLSCSASEIGLELRSGER
jgi:methylglutamate dehydrogenase subunit D